MFTTLSSHVLIHRIIGLGFLEARVLRMYIGQELKETH